MKRQKTLIIFSLGFILAMLVLFGSTAQPVQAESTSQITPCGAILVDAINRSGFVADEVIWWEDAAGSVWGCHASFNNLSDGVREFDVTFTIQSIHYIGYRYDYFTDCGEDEGCHLTSFHGNEAVSEEYGYWFIWYVNPTGGEEYKLAVNLLCWSSCNSGVDQSIVMALAEALWSAAEGKLPGAEGPASGEPPPIPDNLDTYIPPEEPPLGTNPFDVAWDSLPAGLIRNPLIPIAGGLTGAALAWLFSQLGSRPIPGSMQPKGVPPIDNANAQGLYWSERPWDVAGPGYVSKEEYERTKGFLERGYKWTHGNWRAPEEIRQSNQQQQNNRDAVAREDADWRAEWERKRQEGLAKRDAELKRILIENKKEDLIDLEREAIWAQRDRWREVFTGRKDDGSISWPAMGGRLGIAVGTLGYSELLYTPMDGLFRASDRLISGQSATEAILKTGAEMGAEYAAGHGIAKAGGWALKTTYNKVLGRTVTDGLAESAEGIARELPEQLAGKKLLVQEFQTLQDGLRKGIVSQAEYEKAIAKLYQNGGVKDLSALERMGDLSAEQVKNINQGLRTQINEVTVSGTKRTIQEVQESTGVRIKEVMLGDSGSSARQLRVTSINTDADRALMVGCEKSDVEKYANQFHNGNIAKAEQELTTIFKDKQGAAFDDLFRQKGFTGGSQDANLTVYDGFGKPGPVDSYPSGYVRTVQATSGKTTVFRVGPQGNVTSYNTSGQAMVDQHALMTRAGSATPLEAAPRISVADARALAQQQIIAVSKPNLDAEKAAKAVLRMAKATGTEKFDPALLEAAKAWRTVPQQMYQQTGEQGQKQFIEAIRKAVLAQAKP